MKSLQIQAAAISQNLKIYLIAATMIACAAIATSAKASDAPRFTDVGDWVDVANLEQISAQNPNSQALLVILDSQTKLQSGVVSNYIDIAIRIESSSTMSEMASLLNPNWHPDQGDLLVHRFEIIRGEQTIDLTQNDDLFQVIRRERNLERQMINGQLTALSQVENVQLSDIVRVSYTVTKQNDALAGRMQHQMRFIQEGLNIDFLRQTIRWPEGLDVNWRASKDEIAPKITKGKGWTTLSFDHRAKKPDVEIPKNAPQRFKQGDFFEVASFASWKDVSRVNAALYPEDDGVIQGGGLDREIQAIAEQTSDKHEQMALALRLVQDKVRYLYNGLGFGNYAPQLPEETWQLRYGDCKAKTYLLLAVLRRLGIEAEPLLVGLRQRDAVEERLPSFQPFDHIIVRAQVEGEVFWLDGTASGTRLADIGDAPAHRFGLPAREEGAALEPIEIRPLGRPYQSASVVYDLSAGTHLPAVFELEARLRDSDADKIREAQSQLSPERAREFRDEIVEKYVFNGLVAESEFEFDEDLETGFLRATGLSYLDWETRGAERKHEPWSPITTIKIEETRKQEALRDLPVRLRYPISYAYKTTYVLPERYAGFELAGRLEVSEDIGGYQLERSVKRLGNQVIADERYYTNRWELAAADFELERQKLLLLKRGKIKLLLPENAPQPWQEADGFGASIDLEQHRWAMDQHVANAKQGDDGPLTSRAYFHQAIGEYDSAIADIVAALEVEKDPENYKWLADLQLGVDPEAAKSNYAQAIAIRPAYFNALIQLARLHLTLGEFAQAEALLEGAKANGLSDQSFDSLQIEVLQAQGKFDEAMQIINALVDEEPDDALNLADRCMLRSMEKTQLDAAIEDCDNMIEIAKRSDYYHFLRGFTYYQMGDYARALTDLNKAIDADNNASYLYNLRSAIHEKSGDMERAADDRKAAEYFYRYAGWHWNRFFK